MNKIENTKMEVENGINLNDEDYLKALLEIEKNMSINLTIALNEASCEPLYEKLFNSFETIKDLQRDLFEIAFRYGWYSLEEVDNNALKLKYDELLNKFNNLEEKNSE